MRRGLALQALNAAADRGATGDHRGTGIATGQQQRGRHRLHVVSVHFLHMPAAEAEARGNIVALRDIDTAVRGHAVVVPQEGQAVETQMPGQQDDLLPDALLQAAKYIHGALENILEPSSRFGAERINDLGPGLSGFGDHGTGWMAGSGRPAHALPDE